MYLSNYEYIVKSNSAIEAILLDGGPVSDFRPDSLDYAVQLPVGTILLPNISIINGDDSQNVIVTTGGINGITTIDVTAQDGTTTTYIIDFSVLLSENMALEMILLNHENLENGTPRFTVDNDFDSDITSYVVTLPVGTRQYPNITWTKGDDYQQVSLREINIGEFAIDVVAQDSAFTRTYWVTFQILRSQNALLHAIAVNGETLSTTANGYTVDLDFDPNTYTYQLLWPIGTTQLPVITFEAGDTMQTVVINAPQTLNDSIIISVQAEDPAFTSTYTIYCRLLLSENCLLEDISIAGTTLAGFRSDSLTYDVLLPIGTTILPEISWIQGDIYQTVSTVSGGVNSSYTITVKAQDTAFVTNYVINFQVELSHNAHLQALFADAQPINGFDMELFHYHLMLPYATTQVPVISYTASEPTQQITVLQAATLQDTAIVTVIAQDGISYNQYRITFQTMLSDNALLAGIYIDEEIIAMQATGFVADKDYDKDEFNYLITLPNGTTQMPEITWQGEVADYHDVVMNLGTVNGLTTITVTSQDQTDENIYRLTFQVAKSDNALLEDLRIYDKTVNGFDPMVFDYFIQFPIGTDTADLPTVEDVTYMIGHQGQVVSISQADPTTIAVIVTAEDGVAFNVYVISFEILLSDNALLKDIIIDGLSIKDFDPYTFDYSYLLFPGAQVPEIVPVKGEESQEVFLARAAVGEYTYIYVEAEDGTESTYSIFFTNSTDNPGDKPQCEELCWTYPGE